jgi:hypothetical protein
VPHTELHRWGRHEPGAREKFIGASRREIEREAGAGRALRAGLRAGAVAIPSERTGEDSEQNREPLFSRVCWNDVLGVFSFFYR